MTCWNRAARSAGLSSPPSPAMPQCSPDSRSRRSWASAYSMPGRCRPPRSPWSRCSVRNVSAGTPRSPVSARRAPIAERQPEQPLRDTASNTQLSQASARGNSMAYCSVKEGSTAITDHSQLTLLTVGLLHRRSETQRRIEALNHFANGSNGNDVSGGPHLVV